MSCSSSYDGGEQINKNIKENEILGDNILHDLEAYWDDINDRLVISRMVSDSVIKGMVNAIEQEAVDKISQKELEVSELKKMLHIFHVGVNEFEPLRSVVDPHCLVGTALCHSESATKNNRMTTSICSLKMAAEEQFKKLKIEIERIKGSVTVRRSSSGSQIVGLGGLLPEKDSDRWVFVDKIFDSLEDTLETLYERVDAMDQLPNALLSELQQEQDFRTEIEVMVIRNCIQDMKEDLEQKIWHRDAQMYGTGSLNWFNTVNEISELRQELDLISKFLSADCGLLISHGSLDSGDDCCNNKRIDHLYWKLSTNHFLPATMHREGNGKLDWTNSKLPENLDPAPIKELEKDELINYFNSQMTKLKRNHESQVQEITEENFRLKREILRAKDSSSPMKKDKDFEMLRKKIPDFISKLDEVLAGSEKVQKFNENLETLDSLNGRLESLCAENHQLRDEVIDRKKEIISLSSRHSETVARLSQQNLTEKRLWKKIQELEFTLQDAQVEISITHGVYKCLLEEFEAGIRSISEDSVLVYTLLQEIYETLYIGALHNAQPASICVIEDTDVKDLVMKGLLVDIFGEVLGDAQENINDVTIKYINEKCFRLSIEKEALELREELTLVMDDKEKLQDGLSYALQEKEELIKRISEILVEEKIKMDLVTEDLNILRDHIVQQQKIISDSSSESDVIRSNLAEAQNRIKSCQMETSDLRQNLEMTVRHLRELEEDKRAAIQEKQSALFTIEKNESEYKKRIESIMHLVHTIQKMCADFEIQVEKGILLNKSRLGKISSEFLSLLENASILTNTLLAYRKKLERKCSNLEKAEAEVDLLGDEVDMLLNLLEKMYIALDHYSPILRHYPGITEILELVKRELSGDAIKHI